MEILNILVNENWLDRRDLFLLRSVSWELRLLFRLDQLCPGPLLFESRRRKIWLYKNTVFKTLDGQLHGKQQTRTTTSAFTDGRNSVWRYQQEQQVWHKGAILDDGESFYKYSKRHYNGAQHEKDVFFGRGSKEYQWIYWKDRVIAFKKRSITKKGTDTTVLRRKEPKRRNTKEYKRYLNL